MGSCGGVAKITLAFVVVSCSCFVRERDRQPQSVRAFQQPRREDVRRRPDGGHASVALGIVDRSGAGQTDLAAAAAEAPAARPAAAPRAERPSQRAGWVIHAISWFLWNRHYELDELLEDPAMVAQVAAAPQLGGGLRPMCQMLAVKPPAWLRRPRKPRRRVERPPAPDFIMNDPAAIHRPDGTIWKRFGASTNWRKPDLLWDTLEQAQKFDRPRRIWPPRK